MKLAVNLFAEGGGGNCSSARRRGRMQIDFGVPPSFSLPFSCKLFFPFLNGL